MGFFKSLFRGGKQESFILSSEGGSLSIPMALVVTKNDMLEGLAREDEAYISNHEKVN